jgi:N-acetylneuraminic acid mutarotase
LPQRRDHIAVVAAEGRIHVIGGRYYTPVENTNTHDVYDPAKNSWTSAAPLPTPRSGGAGVLYRGRILVFGGECDNRIPFVHNEAYDLASGRWSSLAPMPSGRHGITAAADGDRVYAPGGAPACATAASETLLTFTLR